MLCPRCMYEQADAEECVNCGIVIKKYLLNQRDNFLPLGMPNGDNIPEIRVRTYRTKDKIKRVSPQMRFITLIFSIIMLSYIATVGITYVTTKSAIETGITKLLETSLRHEFRESVISQKVFETCIKNKVDIAMEDIEIEFAPDDIPRNGNNINYVTTITASYKVSFFIRELDTQVNVSVKDQIGLDSMKSLRFKNILDIP